MHSKFTSFSHSHVFFLFHLRVTPLYQTRARNVAQSAQQLQQRDADVARQLRRMEADLDAMCAAFGDESSTTANNGNCNGNGSTADSNGSDAESGGAKADALRARVRTLALRVMASSSSSSSAAASAASSSAAASAGSADSTEAEFAALQADVLAHYERHRAAAECGRASVRHALDEMSARFRFALVGWAEGELILFGDSHQSPPNQNSEYIISKSLWHSSTKKQNTL
jgi:hypothetical protein